MGVFLNNLYNMIMNLITTSSLSGILLACLLIFFESIIPVLPLFVFIGIVMIALGSVVGFLISYVLTCLGCFFSFYLCRTFLKDIFTKYVRKNQKFDKIMQKIDNMKLSSLVLLIAIPFTPAFLINIASALSKMDFKKFGISILIGKISLVFFWGFIATSLVESLKNPKILIVIGIMLLISYLLSKIVTKRLNIE